MWRFHWGKLACFALTGFACQSVDGAVRIAPDLAATRFKTRPQPFVVIVPPQRGLRKNHIVRALIFQSGEALNRIRVVSGIMPGIVALGVLREMTAFAS